MALFIVERNFADELEVTAKDVLGIQAINGELDVNWVLSFLSADKKKTYCLYEAADPALILEAARRAGVPADAIIPVTSVDPHAIVANA